MLRTIEQQRRVACTPRTVKLPRRTGNPHRFERRCLTGPALGLARGWSPKPRGSQAATSKRRLPLLPQSPAPGGAIHLLVSHTLELDRPRMVAVTAGAITRVVF